MADSLVSTCKWGGSSSRIVEFLKTVAIEKLKSIKKKGWISLHGSCQSLEAFMQSDWALPPPWKPNSWLAGLTAGSDPGPDGRTGVTSVEMTKQLFPLVCCKRSWGSQLCCYSKIDSDLETRVLEWLKFQILCFVDSVLGPSPVQHPVQLLEVSAIRVVWNCVLGDGQGLFSQVSVS